MTTPVAEGDAVSSGRAPWEIVADGWHYTREHYKTDPTQFVGDIPCPAWDEAMDELLLNVLAVVLLHAKSDDAVEIEHYHEDGDDECDDHDPVFGSCNGHERHIYVCNQCGQRGDEYGELAWFEWPCATAKAMELA